MRKFVNFLMNTAWIVWLAWLGISSAAFSRLEGLDDWVVFAIAAANLFGSGLLVCKIEEKNAERRRHVRELMERTGFEGKIDWRITD
jgi:hypothetical protein